MGSAQSIYRRKLGPLRLAVLGMFLFSQFNLAPARASFPVQVPGRGETVLLESSDLGGLAELVSSGARELADYGSFSLWQLPAPPARTSTTLARLPRTGSRIDLRGLVIDGAAALPEPPLPPNLTTAPQPEGVEQFWLVQFAGPLQDAWLEQLRGAGQSIAACLPAYACILWGASPVEAIQSLGSLVRWQGAFHAAYRLHPELRPGGALRAGGGELEVTVQVLDVPAGQTALQTLARLAVQAPGPAHKVSNLLDVQARVRAADLDLLASLRAVFNIEPYSPPQKNDEMQAQILAGNTTNSGGDVTASGPGYLAWLNSLGVSADPSDYPILDIVDDGIDNGDVLNVLHPDFYAYPTAQEPYSRVQFLNSCLADGSADGVDGHGNLNAGIAAGYNSQTGSPYRDPAGFAYGLGVSPYGRLAGTKIFGVSGFDSSACGSSYTGIVRQAYLGGARITSNSWGGYNGGSYDAAAQEYDQLTRDADPLQAGNQEMLHVFSAGNSGPSGQSVGTPGLAKNVLSVGATDLPRDVGIPDGCLRPSSASADDIADYSSRGPTQDGRIKPDLVAPGTHIQGPASQDPDYTGNEICGAASGDKRYYPPGQSLYTWSTGTSHAAPAVAGAAQLAWERYTRLLSTAPSPAMVKAMLLNEPRYLNGTGSGDTLPSPNQGWGMPDLGKTFDLTQRGYYDQQQVFGNSGETFTLNGTIPDPAKPFHVTLVWTDPPGATVGAALVNDLDLEVSVGGATYLGNVFNGENSVSGGTADALNNAENVFLPAGSPSNAPFSVRIVARNIAGDGVPNNADATDQDFALVISNGVIPPQPIFSIVGIEWQKSPASINHNGPLEPGQSASLKVTVGNSSYGKDASAIGATLLASAGLATISQPISNYPDLPAGVALNNLTDFQVALSPSQACGGLLQLQLNLSYSYNAGTAHGTAILPLPPLLTARQRVQTYSYPGAPVSIPDKPPGSGQLPPTPVLIPVSFPYPPYHLSASVSITHPRASDLQLWLENPAGTTIQLVKNRGGNAPGFSNLTFDDNAAVSIATISNPPSSQPLNGTFRPENPLENLLDGNPPSGAWTLQALDTQNSLSGLLTAASLQAEYRLCGVVDPPPRLSIYSVDWQETPGFSDMDGILEAGEKATLKVVLQNDNIAAAATHLSVRLEPLSNQTTLVQGASTSSYPNIGDGVSGVNHELYQVNVLSTSACGQDLPFVLQASFQYDNGSGPVSGWQSIPHICQKTWLPLLKKVSP